MRRTASRWLTAIGVMLVLGGLAACGSDDEEASAVQASSASSREAVREFEELLVKPVGIPEWPRVAEPPAGGKQVYYLDNGVAGVIEDGMRDAAEALKWTYHSITYDPSNPATASSAYVTAVNEGADVIVSTGLARAQVEEGLAAARKKGVHVVHMFSLDPPQDPDFVQVGNLKVNADTWAGAAAKGIVADAVAAGTDARVGIVTSSGLPFIQVNADDVKAAIDRLCPECVAEFIDVPAAEFTSGRTPPAVVSYLQRNPDTNYVHMVLGDFAGALRPALDGAGFEQVRLSGLAPLPAQNAAIDGGDWRFWIQVPDEYSGWVVMDSAVRAFTGGDASIHDDEPMPVWIVNEENLDFDVKALPSFPEGYQEQFKALWRTEDNR